MERGRRPPLRTPITALLLSLVCAACIAHTHSPYRGAGSDLATQTAPLGSAGSGWIYPYDRTLPLVSNSDLVDAASKDYRVKHLAFDSVSQNGQRNSRVEVLWYLGANPGAKPTVIVLPIWGRYTYPPNRIAAGLRNLGNGNVNILQVQGEALVLDWAALAAAPTEQAFTDLMAENLERIRTNTIDVSRLIDWAVSRPEVDPTRIGLVGFSHSGITASLVAANDDRPAAIVIVMAGAHPHRLLASCRRGRVAELRESVADRFGWSAQDYQNVLEPITRHIDAAAYPSRIDPSRVLFFDAAKDACFPQDSREALWESLGEPERYTIAYGHKISFLAMTPFGFNWMRQPMYDFLDRHLLISGPS